MPQSSSTQSKPDAAALETAFEALKTYDQGSNRGALMAIDEAVMASLDDEVTQKDLERRLVAVLRHAGSAVAREYICSKLKLIGSALAVPALTEQLNQPESVSAARNALEAIPSPQATRALRASLSKMEGLQKIGVINSLGARRDADSVRALTALLKHDDSVMVGAAAAALGDIANASAAKALRGFLPKAPEAVRLKVADAILTCAERLLAAGKRAQAKDLYRLLASKAQPGHIQLAAVRGIELAEGRN